MDTTVLKPDEIRNKLRDSNLTAVSRNSGVSYKVLYKFMQGADPKFSTIEKLSHYLEAK